MSTQWSKYQQAVFDWHDLSFSDGKGKAVSVRSGAGSGKTTTLVEAGKAHIPPTLRDALSLAFNSDIAKVLKAKYEGTNIDARTYNSFGFQTLLRCSNGQKVVLDQDKTKKIFENLYDRYTYGYNFPAVKQLVSLIKANLVDWNDNSAVLDLAMEYGIELNGDAQFILSATAKVMQEGTNNTKWIDFDDQIYLPILYDMPIKKYDYIQMDESQDTNSMQKEMIFRACKDNTVLSIVGDPNQCVIEGTEISCYNKSMLIQDDFRGNNVLSAFGKGNISEANVTDVYKRWVENAPVVTIKTKSGKCLTTTPEHVYFADFINPKTEEKYYTYLMRIGDRFRVGMAGWYRSIGKGGIVPGFKQRGNQEKADAMWILEISKTSAEARFWEQYYSIRYGLPTWINNLSGHDKDVSYNEELLQRLYSLVDTNLNAMKLLHDKHYQLTRPHYAPKCMSKRRRRNFNVSLCSDCKKGTHFPSHRYMISGSDMEDQKLLSDLGISTRPSKHTQGWRIEGSYARLEKIYDLLDKVQTIFPINVIERANLGSTEGETLRFMPASQVLPGMFVFVQDKNNKVVTEEVVENVVSTYTGFVYDLNVDRTHNYIANGIVVHNSIYGWRGAGIFSMQELEQKFDADILRLPITYRNSIAVVELVRQTFPDIPIEYPDWAEQGEVTYLPFNKFATEVHDNDMILCRNNAPLVRPCYALIRQGKKAIIKGRDIGSELNTLINKMKANNLQDLYTRLGDYERLEVSKLLASDKNVQAQAVEDKVETILALGDGCTTLDDLKNRISTVFSDDAAPITFSTVHKAKGLEAERVFILQPELLLGKRAKREKEIVSEKNVRYVAITRARRQLTFVENY